MKFKKENKGITLMGLVVMIVILIILAAISIVTLTGENGIVEKANNASEETIIAQEKEFVKLAYQELEINSHLNGGQITVEDIKDALDNYDDKIEVKQIDKSEIGQTEVVVDKNIGSEYAEITYIETQHKYVVSLVIDLNKEKYTVSFSPNGGQGGPTSQIKIEGRDLILSSAIPEKQDFTFKGWAKSPESTEIAYRPGDTYTLDKSITLYAIWTEKSYNIKYNLNGGTVAKPNPTEYTASSGKIVLNNPEKEGYIFIGWTGTGIDGTKNLVEIPTGSKGDREYTAQWNEQSYSIKYNLNGGTVAQPNPTEYTASSEKIVLNNPEKEGYIFIGWTGTGLDGTNNLVEIPKGSKGDREYTAQWKEQSYNIKYNLDGGTVAKSNPTEYTASSEKIVLNNPEKEGYIFIGWTGTGLDGIEVNVEIPTGSRGDREYTAQWKEAVYIVDETTYVSTINEALEIAQNGSSIRLLKNKAETESVSINKTVTLELSGYTITQNNTIVIEETGNLLIKDSGNNSEYTGKIINTNGVAIENKGNLTLGEDEGTILMSPAIEGTTFGIVTTGTFSFFDGQVKGTTAINGEGVITPATYYAMATTEGEKEEVTLNTLGNAVCRIGYRYYSTLDAATEEAKSGHYEYKDEPVTMTSNGEYSFVCNADGTLTPNNQGKHYSTANSYIRLNLQSVSENETYELKINAHVSSENNCDFGYATITESTTAPAYDSAEGRFMYISGTKEAANYTATLQGGKIYYLHLGYRKDRSANTGSDAVTINSIHLNNQKIDLLEKSFMLKEPSPVNTEKQTEIILLTNVTVTEKAWTISEIKNIKLELNGFVLSANGNINTVINEGKLEITDSSEEKTGNISNSIYVPIVNDTKEDIKISSINLKSSAAGTKNSYKHFITNNNGTVNIENCQYEISHNYNTFLNINSNGQWNLKGNTINSSNTNSRAITFASSTQNANLENNIINVAGDGIYCTGTGKLTFKGGEILYTSTSGSYNGIYNSSTATIEISDTKIDGFYYQIYNYSTGTINFKNLEINNARYYTIINNVGGTIEGDLMTMDNYGNTGIDNKGNININKLTMIDSDAKYTYAVKNNGNMNIGEVKIHAIVTANDYGNLYGLYNYESGVLNVDSANIMLENKCPHVSYYYPEWVMETIGITNIDSAELNLKQGIIYCYKVREKNTAAGIYSSTSKSITIGEKDGIINNETTNIYGDTYGVYNPGGEFRYYDGIIRGSTSCPGVINDIEENAQVDVQTTESIEEMKLVTGISNAIEIVETGAKYSTIEEAVSACGTGTTYTLKVLKKLYMADSEVTITIDEGKDIIIDLNSYDVYLGEQIVNNGKLKITDNSGSIGRITTNKNEGILNNSGATLEISNCEYINRAKGTSDTYAAGIKNLNILKLDNSTIKTLVSYCVTILNENSLEASNSTIACSSYSRGLENVENATSTMNNINMSSAGNSTIIQNSGVLNAENLYMVTTGASTTGLLNNETAKTSITRGGIDFDGGSYGGSYGIKNYSSNLLSLKDFEIAVQGSSSNFGSTYSYILDNNGTGNINIENGNIVCKNASSGINNNTASTIKLINTSSSAYSTVVYNKTTGTIEIDGEDTMLTSSTDVIYNSVGGNVIVKGGIIKCTGSQNAIHNQGTGSIEIQGGKIESTTSSAIYNYGTGSITVGEKDSNVSKEKPEIIGATYGIYNNSTGNTYFYDGIIKGKTDSMLGNITEIEDGYDMIRQLNEETAYYETYLDQVPLAQIGETQYYDLQEAIDSIDPNNTESTTITILRNATILTSIQNADKKIVIDLNGKLLKINETLVNNSNLEIIDSAEENTGAVQYLKNGTSNEYSVGIQNTGILKLTKGAFNAGPGYNIGIKNEQDATLNIEGTNILSTGSTTLIQNNGVLNLENGNLITTGSSATGILNNETGKATITGGIIDFDTSTYSNSYGIKNNSSNELIIKDLAIEVKGYSSNFGSTYSYGLVNDGTGNISIENSSILCGSISYGVTNNTASTINLTNVNISGNGYYAAYNKGTGTIEIDGPDTILTSSSHIVCNSGNGDIIVKNGTVTGSKYGIYNWGNGNIEVQKGKIESTSTAAIYNYGTGSINIGIKDSNVSIQEPEIVGSTYGIYNNSTGNIYFYDGIIKGKTDSIYGNVTELEEGYDMIRQLNEETTYYETYLSKLPLAQIGETQYYDLQEAIDSIDANNTESTTITILRDATILTTIENSNKKIKIDINGKMLKLSETLVNNSQLEIVDTSEENTGVIQYLKGGTDSEYSIGIQNTGMLKIVYGTLKATSSYSKVISNNGQAEISNSTITCVRNSIGINNEQGGNLNIIETTISTTGSSNLIQNSGVLNLENGNLVTSGYGTTGVVNNETGEATITGGIIDFDVGASQLYGIQNNSSNLLTIKDLKIELRGTSDYNYTYLAYGLANNGTGNISMDNCSISGTSCTAGIKNNNSTIHLINTNIETTDIAITNNDSGTIIMEKGMVVSNYHGISNKGRVEVKSGTIASLGDYYSSTGSIYNESTGTVIIGEQGGEVITATPILIAKKYGVNNSGSMYFYDGTIKALTATYTGTNTELEGGYQIYKVQDEEGYYCDTLVPVGGAVPVATIGSVNYASLQDAILACETGKETIVLQRDIELDTSNLIIEEGQALTINLNGKTITSSSEESTITNNGTLTIKDTSTGGKIENTVSVAIINNGTLTIGVNDGTEDATTPIIKGKTEAITNNGTYNKYDGVETIQ